MRYRALFADSEFRALFAADVLSITGTYLARVAVAALVYQRTGSAAITAAAFAISYLPFVLSPWLSTFADLFPRRMLLIGCDLARGTCVAAILIPGLRLGFILALLFMEAVWRIPWGAARLALLSDILTPDRFPAGNALVSSVRQGLQVGGFAIGGVVVAFLGVRQTLAVDAASYAVSAVIIAVAVHRRPAAWTIAPSDTPDLVKRAVKADVSNVADMAERNHDPSASTRSARLDGSKAVDPCAGRPSAWASTVEGVRTVIETPRMPRLFALLGLGPAVAVLTEGLAVPFARELGGGVSLAGLIMAAPPLGTVLGLFLLGRLTLQQQRRLVAPLAVGCGLSVVVAGLATSLPNARFLVLVILVFSGGCVSYISAIQSDISAMMPTALRGRLFGLANAVLQLTQGLAIILGGVVASLARVDSALIAVALAGTLAIVLVVRMRPGVFDSAPHVTA